MIRPRRVKINHRYWTLVRDRLPPDVDGRCDSPELTNKKIRVRPSLKGERGLTVTIHELLHAGQWNLDEEFVTNLAEDIGKVLWNLGYRSTDPNWP